jgi:hypothetical protein
MVLDASVWSREFPQCHTRSLLHSIAYSMLITTDPTLHRLSTPTEVLSVKRRAAPKLFRNRRLANGQTVRTKAGPEVERKFRAIKEDMAMERRLKHFASTGMSASAAAIAAQRRTSESSDMNEHAGHGGSGMLEGLQLREGLEYGVGTSTGEGYVRSMSDSMMIDGAHEAEYGYYEDISARPQWTTSPSHSLSPTYHQNGDGHAPNLFSPSASFSKSSLEPIAEHGRLAHPHRLDITAAGALPLSLSPTSPLSPPIPGLSTPNYAQYHFSGVGGSDMQMSNGSTSMWQSPPQNGPIPSYFAHIAQNANVRADAATQPHTRSTNRVYSSCSASIHSSPTFKPMTLGMRPIMEDSLSGQMGESAHQHYGQEVQGPGATDAGHLVQYSPPLPQHQDLQNHDSTGSRVAAPAAANPFGNPGHAIVWGSGMDGHGTPSGTPSPMGLMPFGNVPVHEQYRSNGQAGHVLDHSFAVSSLAISPLSRPPALLQAAQPPALQRTMSQGLSIEIPPNTGTFDVSMQGVGQYVSPMSGPSGPPSATVSMQVVSEGGQFTFGTGANTSPTDLSHSSGGMVPMGYGKTHHGGTVGRIASGDGNHDIRLDDQSMLRDGQGGQNSGTKDIHGQKRELWQQTGSIDPKWVTPQGSTFATPVQTPRGESPTGPLLMFFPSV